MHWVCNKLLFIQFADSGNFFTKKTQLKSLSFLEFADILDIYHFLRHFGSLSKRRLQS